MHLGRCHDIYRALLKEVAEGNGIQGRTFIEWEELETTSEPSLQWNVVLCDVVSPQGILRPNVFEELGTIRYNMLHSISSVCEWNLGHQLGRRKCHC